MDPIQTRAEARTMWDADRAALRDAGLDLFGATEYLSRELVADSGEMSIAKMAMARPSPARTQKHSTATKTASS